ncbi:cysteine synthase A [Paenactinomyces guangxiensis]|uniref:Cysteine synthase n=1 Tax=Paenactinomyces guangxiensis TaxID=1490290 RepID=A0A7W1WPL9_9BACL|nr:cysteine synthase A [Paenactinomyces guangxiensis]MBA4493737.1 cysteine synthase A [Paenactinomyces guangxiensis]MBH8591025.1 cysteine synthase A [Paenactinomyces guangxiensis]
MKNIYEDVKDLIGHTPMVRLKRLGISDQVKVYAKLEFFNPGGSVKDRLGLALIEDGERSGKLRPGGTIIEPTAGNTGIGLALAAVGTDYRVIFVVPEKFSEEKQELMRALGAEVVHTPTEEGIKGAIKKAEELAKEIPGSFCPQQFANPANPQAHYETTGPEIWEQMDGQVDIFVAGAGSAGTFMGVARYLKEKNPRVKTVIVEPEGSIIAGGKPGPHKTEGIGMELFPGYFDRSYIDEIYTVTDKDAFHLVKELAHQEGLLVGSSSGAACYAALKEAEKAPAGTRIAVIFPDSSERYLSKKIYQGGV